MAASELSSEQMQAKIIAARREAESLKDKIKRRKDELADTTCKLFPVPVMLFRSAIPSRSMTFVTPLAKPPPDHDWWEFAIRKSYTPCLAIF